jgi:hypothetical protein
MWRIRYALRARQAKRYYRNERGYAPNQLPCASCVWEHDPDDTETPWQWIYCNKCDWGNR